MTKKVDDQTGRNVRLREITYEDTPRIVAWRNDPVLGEFLGTDSLDGAKQNAFLDRYFTKDDDFYFVAENLQTGLPIGTVALYDVNMLAKNAEWGRLLVLQDQRVHAMETSLLLLRFAFEELGLHKVHCLVQNRNQRALHFDMKLGFREEGVLKEHYWNGRSIDDLHCLAMFKSDYETFKKKYQSFLSPR